MRLFEIMEKLVEYEDYLHSYGEDDVLVISMRKALSVLGERLVDKELECIDSDYHARVLENEMMENNHG